MTGRKAVAALTKRALSPMPSFALAKAMNSLTCLYIRPQKRESDSSDAGFFTFAFCCAFRELRSQNTPSA